MLPANVGYGRVVGRFIEAVADTSDPGTEPDAVPAQGTVVFTPTSTPLVNAGADPSPVTVLPRAITCTLDSEGYLTDPAGNRGVSLVATDDPDMQPVGWTYQVQLKFTGVTGLAPFAMAVPEGTEQDLSLARPITPAPGTVVVVNEQLYLDTVAARDEAVAAAQSALVAVSDTAPTDPQVGSFWFDTTAVN